jgi:glycosyltransferase involved in cell wall biosynthesis
LSVARRDPAHVVMVGTSPATRGGIAAVINAYRSAGLFARWPIDYVETHCRGSAAAKLACALRAFFRLLVLIGRYPKAVLHVHAASHASFWRKCVFMSLARLAGWPVVFHLHGGGFARFYERECGPIRRRMAGFFLDRAACIVVLSERWSAWMRSVTENPRIVCVPNPVTLPSPRPSPKGEGEKLVAFVGRCEEGKGVFDLLAAVSEVRRAFPSVRLECAGDGDLDAVRRRAFELGMGTKVNLRGWIGPRHRDELFARAAVFVLPSHAEGLPMSLLEAMAAGAPVVASAVGGIPDLIEDGVNGLLVPAGDTAALALAIHRMLADRELAAHLGEAARETVARRYTIEQSLERLEQVYSGLGVCRVHASPVAMPRRLQEIS